jgi:DNA repair exonuclease SbcCD ATPase subunit
MKKMIKMKKLIWILLIIPFFVACNQEKVKQLEMKNDSLVQQANFKDEAIGDFLQSFVDIQNNIDSIKAKEMMITEITEGKMELRKPAKDQINDDINSIYQLLIDNKEKVEKLRKKLGNSNYQIAQLEKMIDQLSKQLEERDAQVESLRVELEAMNIKVNRLSRDVNELSQQNRKKAEELKLQGEELDKKTSELFTAYYAAGTKKVLKENNIITKEGGFIGIGSTKKLKSDFNEDFFTKIDIRTTSAISIPGKKATILTNHPKDSYSIEGKEGTQVLLIQDYEKFWKSSKYLVIIIN